jgi:hypothetical protein
MPNFHVSRRVHPGHRFRMPRYTALAAAALLAIASIGLALAHGCGGSSAYSGTLPPGAPPNTTLVPFVEVGRKLYVTSTGDDGNDGSPARPWLTIQRAAQEVLPGDTVHVAPGVYSQPVVTNVSGTAAARIRFISDVQWGAQIVTIGAYSSWDNEGDYVDIGGFDISGDGSLGIVNNGSHVRVFGNRVHDIPVNPCTDDGGAGIDHANYSAQDNYTVGNWVFNIGIPSRQCPRVHGIYHSNFGGYVWNNIAFGNEAWGIHLWHAPQSVVVANNLLFSNGLGGIMVGAGDAPGGIIANNIIVNNNLIVFNPGDAIQEQGATGPANFYGNNLVFANGAGIVLQTGLQSGTISADPALVNFQPNGTGNYQLQPGSPAIRAGTSEDAPNLDINGGQRPTGVPPDIGPYQFSAPPAPWPWM